MNNQSKTSSKLFLILFVLNILSGLLIIMNNFNGKRGSVILGFLIVVISIVMLLLTGKDLYKMRVKNEENYKN